MVNNSCILWFLKIRCQMATLDPPGLPSGIHRVIKYQMAASILITYQNMFPILQYFKGHTYLVHLFYIGILPQSVSILFVNMYGLFNIIGNMYFKLVVMFPRSTIYQINDNISLLKIIWHPAWKGLFIRQAKSYHILCHLNKVWLFQNLQIHPRARTIFQLN